MPIYVYKYKDSSGEEHIFETFKNLGEDLLESKSPCGNYIAKRIFTSPRFK
jgi:hypothetical protein